MERLTYYERGYARYDFGGVQYQNEIATRLAAYEDTGLESEQCAKYAQAEKEGRLMVLPCKVGDTVYTNIDMSGWYMRSKKRLYSAKVVFIGLNADDGMGGGLINVKYDKGDYMNHFCFSDFGKTVFLTREEAEKALKERDM